MGCGLRVLAFLRRADDPSATHEVASWVVLTGWFTWTAKSLHEVGLETFGNSEKKSFGL